MMENRRKLTGDGRASRWTIGLVAGTLALAAASCGGAADPTKQLTPARSPAGTSTGCGTVLIAGSSWLQGQGVDVLSNGTGYLGSCTGGSAGYGYQCVDLAYRLYGARGWGRVYAAGNGGAYYIPEGSPVACASFHGNGSYVPVPGDLIIENMSSANGGYGHVAVVDSVSGSTINAVEQNTQYPSGGVWYDHPRHTYSIDGNNNIGGGYSGVRGTCHSSSNPFTNAPPGLQYDNTDQYATNCVANGAWSFCTAYRSYDGYVEGRMSNNCPTHWSRYTCNYPPCSGTVRADRSSPSLSGNAVNYSFGNWGQVWSPQINRGDGNSWDYAYSYNSPWAPGTIVCSN
jgi:hypothetical protein